MLKTKTINKSLIVFSLMLVSFLGCKDSDQGTEEEFDASSILSNVSVNIITATYADLDAKAALLETAATNLKNNPTSDNLEAARTAWKNARRPWEMSEGFLFGPVDTKGIDPSIDSWPLNKEDLDGVLASDAVLTKSYIDIQIDELKGFHTIEYLLFGENANKIIGNFTDREYEYLLAATQSFKARTEILVNSWKPEGENYQANLINVGINKIYTSSNAVIEELIRGMVGIADEVANGKIETPFSLNDVLREESHFSNNSKSDFQDNIRSIQNVYLGKYGEVSGAGVSDFVKSKSASLDTRFKQEVADAIDAIGAIPGTFTDAIISQDQAVVTAQQKVRKVQQTLEENILPLISQ